MPPQNETVDSLAAKIKAKYPQYGQVDNQQLVSKIIAKYPQYKSALAPGALGPSTPATPAEGGGVTGSWDEGENAKALGIPETQAPKGIYQHITQAPFPGPINESVNAFANRSEWEVAHGNPVRAALYGGVAGATHDMSSFLSPLSVGSAAATGALGVLGDLATDAAVTSKTASTVQEAQQAAVRARNLGSAYKTLSTVSKVVGAGLAASQVPTLVSPNSTVPQRLGAAGMVLGGALPFAMPSDQDILAAQATQKFRGQAGPSTPATEPPAPQPALPNIAPQVAEPSRLELAPEPETLLAAPKPAPSASGLPELAPAEHAEQEQAAGRPLSTDEAHAQRIRQVKAAIMGKMLAGEKPTDIVQQTRQAAKATPAEIVAGKNGPEETTTLPPAPVTPAPAPKLVGPVALPRDVENLRDQMNFHGLQGRRTDLPPAAADAHMARAKALSKQIGQHLDAYSAQLSPSQRSELADTLASRATRSTAQASAIRQLVASHAANAPTVQAARDMLAPTGHRVVTTEEGVRVKGAEVGLPSEARQALHTALGDKTKEVFDEVELARRAKMREEGIDPDAQPTGDEAQSIAQAQEKLGTLKQKFAESLSDAKDRGLTGDAALKAAMGEVSTDFAGEVRTLQDIIGRKPTKTVYAGKAEPVVDKATGAVSMPGEAPVITQKAAQAALGTTKHIGLTEAIPRLASKAKQLELDAAQYGAFSKRLTRQSGSVGTAPRPYIQTGEYNLNPEKLEATAKRQPNLVWKISDRKPAGEYGWISPDGKYFVSAMKETHDIALTHALGFKDSSAPDVSAIYDQAHQEGWVRKAYAGEYSTGHLTPQSLDVMNNDMLLNLPKLDNNAPITIDEINHSDTAAVGGSKRTNSRLLTYSDYLANDFDLGKTIQDYDRRYSMMKGQRGAGGSQILAGMAAGGLAGAASGHPLVAAAGAIAGGLVPAAARALGPELTDIARSVGGHVGDTYNAITHFLSPKTGVSRDTLDAIYQMKGGIDAANYMAAASLKAFRKTFDAMPDDERIGFIDRFKQGKEQPTPELQGIANTIRQMDKEDHNLLSQYNPSVPFMENHFRLLYKKLPGGDENKFTGFMGRRPLQGTRGFMKQHTFEDLSSAMAEGGVPITTNPVDMWLLAHADVMRYTHVQELWNWAKDSGARKFVKMGQPIPDGYTRLNDNLAKVYFLAKSREGLVSPGEWAVEEGFGRLLNNYLSRDYIRGNVLGKSLLDLKNVTSAWNLFGPFHAVKMSGMAIANDLNLGTRALQSGDVIEGLKQYLGAAGAPVRTFLEGRNLQNMMEDRNKFLQSDKGQAFMKAYPNAEQLLDDAFHGGLRLDISPDYKVDMLKSALENFHNGKYISGTLKMPAAMIYTAMKPLFEHYIPSLKVGAFMRDMSAALTENADALASGSKTRSEVARGVVDRIDNAFGQINFDNLFWHKTMKSMAQLEYTSVTWRLGNMRLTRDALVGQLRDFNNARKGGSIPKMNPNLGLLLHEALVYGLAGAAITYLMAHKRPQSVKDLLRPQIGGVDAHGKPLRVNLPAYASRDIPQLVSNPIAYVAGGQSALLARGAEVLRNKDFYNQEIRNPDDPKMKQFWEMLSHLAPPNLTQRNMSHLLQEGAPRKEAFLGVAGAYPASSRTDMTSAEIEAQARAARYYSAGPRTSESVAHGQAMSRAVAMMRNNSPALNDTLRQDITAGRLSLDDMDKIQERATTPYLTQLASTPGMTLNDLLAIAQKGNPAERQELLPLIVDKMDQMDNLPLAQQQKISDEIKVLAHSH